MNTNLIAVVDRGGRVTKAGLKYIDGKYVIVKDESGNDTHRTAVYRNPESGNYCFSDEATEAGKLDKDNLAVDWKAELEDPTKKFFSNTAIAAEVDAIFFAYLKKRAEATAGQPIDSVCISVFNTAADSYVCICQTAAEKSGWKVLPEGRGGQGIVREASAAAIAYGIAKDLAGPHGQDKALGFSDLGSTTLDNSILIHGHGAITSVGSSGDMNLGAKNIQEAVLADILAQAQEEKLITAKDLEKLKTVEGLADELYVRSETVMKALSQRDDYPFPMPLGKKRSKLNYRRKRYETNVLTPIVARHLECWNKAVEDAKPKLAAAGLKIEAIVALGGGLKPEFSRKMIAEQTGIPVRTDIDPQWAVCHGLGDHALNLKRLRKVGGLPAGPTGPRFREVTPYDISVMTALTVGAEPLSHVLIPRGQPAPTSVTQVFHLLEPSQTIMKAVIVQSEGNGQPIDKCDVLGETDFKDLPTEATCTDRISTTALFDSAGRASIEIVDLLSGQRRIVEFSVKQQQAAA
jgi:molecular chaperone DnaK (HSP70)